MGNPLSKYFSGIAAKRLSAVEIRPDLSNQHEFNGINEFKEIFGTEKIKFKGKFLYLPDNEDDAIEDEGELTWYDARANHATRTEYRIYYSTNVVMSLALVRDLLVIGRTAEDELVIFIAPEGSTSEKQLLWLFGIAEVENKFIVKDLTTDLKDIGYAEKHIISALGIEIKDLKVDYLNELIDRFGNKFPKTFDFSAFARSKVIDISPIENPDLALISWLDQEEMLFKTLENHIVKKKLEEGFGSYGSDVDEFINFSLSVHNRRKSRAGYSFEHHLAFIFDKNSINYSRGQKTERNNKPDFLFPDIKNYKDPSFPLQLLTMLGVKTTAKDRWRQILSEAEKIKQKHLITLETAISTNQTEEMVAQKVQLIVPEPFMQTYSSEQQNNILNLFEFIQIVRERQIRLN